MRATAQKAPLDDLRLQAERLQAAGPEAVRAALAELDGPAAELLSDAIALVDLDAYRDRCARSLEENADGTIIVRLSRPVMVAGEEVSRLTVGAVKVRHHRLARDQRFATDAYADALVRPEGAVGELETDRDYMAVLVAVERQLGKFRGAGDSS